MPLKKTALNEELGNGATHFFKSGNILRSAANKPLDAIREMLPARGPHNTNLEYDIWYDTGDLNRVHGYVYTDIMTKFVYLRAAGAKWSHRIMADAAKGPITEEGEQLFQEVANNAGDKYMLRSANVSAPFVVFLAGTNIIDKATDWGKLKNAVNQGAKLKCHPLTAPPLLASLKKQFGAENILEKKLSGHQILEQASIVGCTDNSEMGLVALAKGKTVYRFGGDSGRQFTYSAIYNAVWGDEPMGSTQRWKAILSAPYSGLVPSTGNQQQQRIDAFFNYYSAVPHATPKNSNN